MNSRGLILIAFMIFCTKLPCAKSSAVPQPLLLSPVTMVLDTSSLATPGTWHKPVNHSEDISLSAYFASMAQGDFEKAYAHLEEYAEKRQTILRDVKNSLLQEYDNLYGQIKKEQEIERLSQERKRQDLELKSINQKKIYYSLFLLSVIAILFTVLLVYLRRAKIKKNKLLSDLAEEERQWRYISIIQAQDQERRKFSNSITETIMPLLTQSADTAVRLAEFIKDENGEVQRLIRSSIRILDESCKEAQILSSNLMPQKLIVYGLNKAIEDLANDMDSCNKIEVRYSGDVSLDSLDKTEEIHLYRIVQELLSNTCKHSHASLVDFSIKIKAGICTLTYRDNGIGFTLDKIKESSGIGWNNILSRTDMLKASMTLASDNKNNTLIILSFPLNKHQSALTKIPSNPVLSIHDRP